MYRTLVALWGMARPLIMISVILVYVDGLLIARAYSYVLAWDKMVWGLAVLLLVAASIHYANEFADYETDSYSTPTLYSGGSGVLPRGNVPRHLALYAGWVALIICFGLTLLGHRLGALNTTALLCLVLGAFGGWMYSLPPLRLAWRGWGELDNALLGGLLLHIYGFVILSDQITIEIILLCLPFTLLTFNNLLATTWADKHADTMAGKYTLATRLPSVQLRRLYSAAAICAFMLLLLLHGRVIPGPVVYASLLAMPLVILGWRTYTRLHSPFPASNAMIVMLLAQILTWYGIA